ncbi:GerAB/ArcD/ProY family transporter [Paenibacillus elgii]|uniref:GerAB/ArcD/ProY family transporter n=1 Tax=Paenibacillus elgii TaxID=189691 RepID=UPI00203F4C42|nr:GerAB/ArcD/ProY family transporter [Paenibacillus elgii]MCM3269757.1 spore germination protein [Paenibacillus elgii]
MIRKDEITSLQASLIVAKSMIGTGILFLPQVMAKEAGTPDGWISVLIGGLLALLFGYIIIKLNGRFPRQTFFEFSQTVFGKAIGAIHIVLLSAYFTISSGYLTRVMGEVIHMYLLDKTPISCIILVFMMVGAYLATGGINPIARFIELFFPMILIILITLIGFSFEEFELDNIRPVLGEGFMPVWKGIASSTFAYSGFEIMLVLSAFMKKPRDAVKSMLTGISIVIPLYTLTVLISIGTLTVEEVRTLTWPTMSVAKDIELPGGFFERFESLFSVLWVISMYATFVPYYYVASLGLGHLFRRNFRIFIYLLFPVIYIIAIFPKKLNDVLSFGGFLNNFAMFVIAIMPIYFWIFVKLRRKGHENG